MKVIKVIHLHLIETDEDYYFGSLKALCENFNKEQIGITYTSLRNVSPSEKHPFSNAKCIIKKGMLVQVETNRRKSYKKIDN